MSVQLKNVTFGYDKPLFTDYTLTLPDQPIVAITGPSGCGKTTLLKLLLGLASPRSGQITGLVCARIGAVFQEDRLLPWLSIIENIELVQRDPTAARDSRKILNALGLIDYCNAMPSALSGGMKRRAAIARAIYHSADMLIMDEPFRGLDGSTKRAAMALCADSCRRMIFVTHDLMEAEVFGASVVALPPA
ncbi:MAG: ATP-binding cassette domain-containing protein [Bacillota bacterium]